MQKGVAERQADVPAEHRIVFRIGINLGDVVVEGEDLLGDGVNVAARLEQLCEPGGVLVSGTAYDQLQGKLDLTLEFVGEQRVKNISRPVRTYRVRLDGSRPSCGSTRGAFAAGPPQGRPRWRCWSLDPYSGCGRGSRGWSPHPSSGWHCRYPISLRSPSCRSRI